MNIPQRLEALRRSMEHKGIDAYIITGSDPHGSEHPPRCWETRQWFSGFSGSAGTLVLTSDQAGLWTDFRYWIQASGELSGSSIELFRDGSGNTPSVEQWLVETLPQESRVGVDGRTVSARLAARWEIRLSEAGMHLAADVDLIDLNWTDRPGKPTGKVVTLSKDEAGESRRSRLNRLRAALATSDADTWIGTALDDTAWLLNVRGNDIPYNPVVVGYLLVCGGQTTWYTDGERLPEALKEELLNDGVSVAPYESFFEDLGNLDVSNRLLLDEGSITRQAADSLPKDLVRRYASNPVSLMKARKNQIEAARIACAMEKDGVALVRFFMELEDSLNRGEKMDELDAAAMLRKQRSALPGFLEESFSPIPAVGGHGAICHYEPNRESAAQLRRGNDLFLCDSGGQWEEGTTDITRTISLGSPGAEQMRDYSLVLKAHIGLSRQRFPVGTRGYQLDALTRSVLWNQGMDYGHGTGHGVGYRLCVHEGPQVINTKPVDVAMEPGMIISNEPGLYREGEYGIRIENLLLCREDGQSGFGAFLSFDTLSLAPYDRRLIDTSLLDADEIQWIDAYHREVVQRLSPLLKDDEVRWLSAACAPLQAAEGAQSLA